MSDYSKWFWDNCDELSKDTSFAHRLAESAWNHQQARIDELEEKIRKINSIAENMQYREFISDYGRNSAINIASEIKQILRGEE